jgi:hypothetical protein
MQRFIYLYGPDGKCIRKPTFTEFAQIFSPDPWQLRMATEILAKKNRLLEDKPWKPLLYDQFGRELR